MRAKIDGKEEEILIIHMKSPKEDYLRLGVNIELFETSTLTCPLEAWHKWQKVMRNRIDPTKPLICQGSALS